MLINLTMDKEMRRIFLQFCNSFEKGVGKTLTQDVREIIIDSYVQKMAKDGSSVIDINNLDKLTVEEQVVAVTGYYSSETMMLEGFGHFILFLYNKLPFLARLCDPECRELLALKSALGCFDKLASGGIGMEQEEKLFLYLNSIPKLKRMMFIRVLGCSIIAVWFIIIAVCLLMKYLGVV